jgi:hypothetical protein
MAKAPQSESESNPPLERLRTLIAPVSQLAALVVILVGVTVWGVRLQDKVDKLESQLQALAISPTITRPAPDFIADPKAPERRETVPNPLIQTCVDIATRLAKAHENSAYSSVITGLQSLMKDLGCSGLASPKQ